MREKPILFSTPMVEAILAGRKTQTRRVVKPQLQIGLLEGKYRYDGIQEGIHAIELLDVNSKPTEKYFHCGKPRFLPGDVLWVRETWDCSPNNDRNSWDLLYAADGSFNYGVKIPNFNPMLYTPQRWRPSIHMRREVARLFLEVKAVRVERLQEINDEDAHAEGMDSPSYPIIQYKDLWNELNSKRGYGWDSNPWVWVIEFRRNG